MTRTNVNRNAHPAPFSRIVAATDSSEAGAWAVARATRLASEHDVPVELLNVARRKGLDARIAAHAGPHTLLVVGGRGENGLRGMLLGSSAERVLEKADGAVLIVKAAPVAPYGRVLAALDLAEGSEQVLEAAVRTAPAAIVTAAHAYEVPFEGMLHRSGVRREHIEGHRGEALRSALDRIEEMSSRFAPSDRIVAFAERGDPARLLTDRATGLGSDLIVMGRRRRGAAERFFVGSVAHRVVADASSDVLVVPQRRDRAEWRPEHESNVRPAP